MAKKTDKQKYTEKRKKNLTPAEQEECVALEGEVISKISKPKEKIYKGCVIKNADPIKVKRLRKLRKKARGIKE